MNEKIKEMLVDVVVLGACGTIQEHIIKNAIDMYCYQYDEEREEIIDKIRYLWKLTIGKWDGTIKHQIECGEQLKAGLEMML